ncbi:MAG: UvrD-helicase domain-containing protein, partial [Candidatus Peribacteraceae bacterium]|nr:UvrD-helicase domain-containing protein [Candidatus Peribacteraceae bacterium]
AGAGSGKTKALTHRIAYLMEQGVQPWQILAVTFTNKAANAMKERIQRMLHVQSGSEADWRNMNGEFSHAKLPIMGTFHSICARILRRDIEHLGGERHFVIYDTDDQQKIMKQILKEMNIEDKELKPKAVLSYIGRFKAEALLPKEAQSQATSAHMQQVVTAYGKYQKALKEANALDFDDLILETVRLFHECPDVLAKYQNTWKYLHVDEYQDTNHAQYLFISLLAKKDRNLCVIGDPDQSIYSFRGADIRNILEFEKEYPDALKIKLEQNYRSHQTILDSADAVIAANPNRPQKKMWTDKKEGSLTVLHEIQDEKKEAEEALKTIKEYRKENGKYGSQVVLYRTNAQSRLLEEACLKSGVPYRIVGGVKFYARREVKDVLAYLHAILNPNDTLSLLRILNVPSRKIGLTTIGKLQAYANENSLTLWNTLEQAGNIESLNDPTVHRLEKFVEILSTFRERAKAQVVSELAIDLIEKINLNDWLDDETEEGEQRWQNVQELITVMHKYDLLEPRISLTSFLEEVSLISEVDSLNSNEDDALTLMTLHLCKGLEFENVIMVGCEEGIFPHANCMFDKEQMEEERRIMYVGMTRAKAQLHLMYTQNRMLWGQSQNNAPSRFIDDIPEECLERRSDDVLSVFAWAGSSGIKRVKSGGKIEPFRQESSVDIEFNQDISFEDDINQTKADEIDGGSRVRHPSFGLGIVASRRGDIVEIRFDSGETKSFALSIAPIQPA